MREGLVAFILTLLASPALAQTPACEALAGPKKELARKLLESEHPYDGCDDTIARCLAARPVCRLAVRLADDVCRRVAAGQDEARIRRALSRRARSMVGGGAPAEIDLASASLVGSEAAPVTVVVYACARCPYCSKLVPSLHGELKGRLKGIARLGFRTFPIRGHAGSTEAGLAFAAAARMGRLWDYALAAYARFDEAAPGRAGWAREAGLDPAAFAALIEESATREALVASKKEGIVNGVEETPTLFLNGRRWASDLTLPELVDAIEEEAERVRGDRWVGR